MVNIAAYLDDLVPQIENISGIRCTLDCEPVVVTGKLAADIGILINELVANAAKHAYGGSGEGSVEIRCTRDGTEGLIVSVRDHGPGYHPGSDNGEKSLGMMTVYTLVKQHHGGCEVVNNGGAEFRIYLPLAAVPSSADQAF
jgi:two-component sensor histidine kinase